MFLGKKTPNIIISSITCNVVRNNSCWGQRFDYLADWAPNTRTNLTPTTWHLGANKKLPLTEFSCMASLLEFVLWNVSWEFMDVSCCSLLFHLDFILFLYKPSLLTTLANDQWNRRIRFFLIMKLSHGVHLEWTLCQLLTWFRRQCSMLGKNKTAVKRTNYCVDTNDL